MPATIAINVNTDKNMISSISNYLFGFDSAIKDNPVMANATTAMPPIMNSRDWFISIFIILANIIPPKTNLAMSMKNFPVSSNTISFLFSFIHKCIN